MNWALRVARVARGYPLRRLAFTLNSYVSRLWRIECGFAKPTRREIQHYEMVLELPASVLFADDQAQALASVLSYLKPHQRKRAARVIEEARCRLGLTV